MEEKKLCESKKSAESCMIPDPHPIDYFVAPNAAH